MIDAAMGRQPGAVAACQRRSSRAVTRSENRCPVVPGGLLPPAPHAPGQPGLQPGLRPAHERLPGSGGLSGGAE